MLIITDTCIEDLPGEVWKLIDFAPGYEVSNLGRVKSWRRGAPKMLVGGWVGKKLGYPSVLLQINGKARTKYRHQLVLHAFVGPRPLGHVCRHLNDDKTDTRLENLSWGTYSENEFDKVRNGIHHQVNKTHCPKGHEYTPENTKVIHRNGGTQRNCKKCQAAQATKRNPRRRVGYVASDA